MSNIIEDFYCDNIEPQEVNSELTPKLNTLVKKKEELTALFQAWGIHKTLL